MLFWPVSGAFFHDILTISTENCMPSTCDFSASNYAPLSLLPTLLFWLLKGDICGHFDNVFA